MIAAAAVGMFGCSSAGGGGAPGASGNPPLDPDGIWTVTAYLACSSDTDSSCAEIGSTAVQVSGGQFSGTIFRYVQQVSATATCSETVSVQGTMTVGETALIVSGTEFQAGDCINGGNGFSGFVEPPYGMTTVPTNAGWLEFVRGESGLSDGGASADAANDAASDTASGSGGGSSSSGSSSGGGSSQPCWECCCVSGGSRSCGGSASGPSATCPNSCVGTCATGTMQCVSVVCNMP